MCELKKYDRVILRGTIVEDYGSDCTVQVMNEPNCHLGPIVDVAKNTLVIDGWRAIGLVPKGEMVVLGAFFGGSWVAATGMLCADAEGDPYWKYWRHFAVPPTHWLPLPQPPIKEPE